MKARFATLLLALSACSNTDRDVETSTGGQSGKTSDDAPTWHADVAPIIAEHCQGCHQAGAIAPFALETYAQAKMWSSTFEAVISSGTMPPFLAKTTAECAPRFGYRDDLSLDERKTDLVQRWVDAGCPEGDPASAAPLPRPPQFDLDDAEVELRIPNSVTISGPGDRFVCFSLQPDFAKLAPTGPEAELLGPRVLIDAAQVRAGNAAIVHHVLVYTDAAGESAALAGRQGYYDCFGGPQVKSPGLVMAWAPGTVPIRAPEGVAIAIPSTGRLVMQVHYHPTGAPQTDEATAVQLRRYKAGIPEYVGKLELVGNAAAQDDNGMGLQPGTNDGAKPRFLIPAGARDHVETMKFALPATDAPYRLWAIGAHMHYVGTNMRIGISRAVPGDEPAEECLLETPEWDFNWQRGYLFDVPIAQAPSATPGDVLNLRCSYDNSMQNPFVQSALSEQGLSAPRDVKLGEETLDEMCLGIFGVAQKFTDLVR